MARAVELGDCFEHAGILSLRSCGCVVGVELSLCASPSPDLLGSLADAAMWGERLGPGLVAGRWKRRLHVKRG